MVRDDGGGVGEEVDLFGLPPWCVLGQVGGGLSREMMVHFGVGAMAGGLAGGLREVVDQLCKVHWVGRCGLGGCGGLVYKAC